MNVRGYRYFYLVVAVFTAVLLMSNILAVKLLQIGPFIAPAGVLVFPVSYIFGDVLTEVYGFKAGRRAIWTAFGCNLLFVVVAWLVGVWPAAQGWTLQGAYDAMFGFSPVLLTASLTAFVVGEWSNSLVLSRMKLLTAGKLLWTRTIASTIVGEGLDSCIFVTLAFGVLPRTIFSGYSFFITPWNIIGGIIITQWVIKVLYETVATPLTYAVVNKLKKAEQEDVFDWDKPWVPIPGLD